MLKRLVLCLVLLIYPLTCSASPLQDFTPGHMALDVNWKPNSFEGGKDKFDISGTIALDKRLALNLRRFNYSPDYNGINYNTSNSEANLIYKLDPRLQVYTGYSHTRGHRLESGSDIATKAVWQAGVIALKNLTNRTTLYTLLGGGDNVANVEFGLSYLLKKNLEFTTTYRHLTVEKVGHDAVKENFRGFGFGVTYKID